jgi:hypothetical protein
MHAQLLPLMRAKAGVAAFDGGAGLRTALERGDGADSSTAEKWDACACPHTEGRPEAGALVAAVRDEPSAAGDAAPAVGGSRPAPACGCLPFLGLPDRCARADGQGDAGANKTSSNGASGGDSGGGSCGKGLQQGKKWFKGMMGEVKADMLQGMAHVKRSLKAALRGAKQALLQAGDSDAEDPSATAASSSKSGSIGSTGGAPGWAHIGVLCMGALAPRPMHFWVGGFQGLGMAHCTSAGLRGPMALS